MRLEKSKSFFNFSSSPLLVLLVGCILLSGCRSSMRNNRETALLRAEILDLEDQYYALKARCESAERALNDQGYSVPIIGSDEVIVDEGFVDDVPYYEGEVIYDDQYDNELIIDDPVINGTPETNEYMHTRGFRKLFESSPTSTTERRVLFPRLASWFGFADRSAPPSNRRQPLSGWNRFSSSGYTGDGLVQRAPSNRGMDNSIPDLVIEEPEFNQDVVINAPLESRSREPFDATPLLGDEDGYSQPAIEGPEIKVPFTPGSLDSPVDVVINTRITRGENIDGLPGDEGLVLLLQPKSKSGNVILDHGKLSVSLIDAKAAQGSQRIGLWKFTSNELALFTADDDPSAKGEQGYLLHLPWDRTRPQSEQVELFVRYETSTGQTLETRNSITISPPGQNYSADSPLVAGWTKRDSSWQREDSASGQANHTTTPVRDRSAVPAIPASTSSRPRWRPNR